MKPVVQTVVVPQTVVVEKQVEVPAETVIRTVVVEKEVMVAGETVVQTVIVEKEVVKEVEVEVLGETVVEAKAMTPRQRQPRRRTPHQHLLLRHRRRVRQANPPNPARLRSRTQPAATSL